MIIRTEQSTDKSAISAVIADAFNEVGEANLVANLRDNDDLAVSMVAVNNDEILGHVAMSRLKAPNNALALAPVSVNSAQQNSGIGTELVCHALDKARAQGFDLVFVLGAPEYNSRFGFSLEIAARFSSDYSGEHFMALWLNGEKTVETNTLIYPNAFTDLD